MAKLEQISALDYRDCQLLLEEEMEKPAACLVRKYASSGILTSTQRLGHFD